MNTEATQKNTVKRKTLTGVVVSDKMQNTAVVAVERYIKHSKYQKYIQHRKRFKVHNEGNKAKTGDKVIIGEIRPMSRHKTFTIVEITERPIATE
jgi:small subunit ribosomal protein S17